MRILLVSHYALPHIGGIEILLDGVRRELGRRGHEVVHVACDDGGGGRRIPTEPGVIRVPALSAPLERRGVPWPVFSPALAGVLRRELARADVVHAAGWLYLSTVGALLLSRRLSRPGQVRVLSEHAGFVHYRQRRLRLAQRAAIATLGRAAVAAAHAVVVNNRRVADEVRRLVPGAPVEVVPGAVDVTRFRPPAPGERARLRARLGWDDRPRVLFVGRAVAKKNLPMLIRARASVPDIELVVVGPGQEGGRDPDGVRRLGACDHTELPLLFRAADALALPSHSEGLPLAALEAVATGLPVLIGADRGFASALVESGLVHQMPAEDPAAWAAALRRVAAGELPRDAGAPLPTAPLSIEATVDRLEWLYRRLAPGSAHARPPGRGPGSLHPARAGTEA